MAKWPYNTRAWRDLRSAKLSASPHCEPCRAIGRSVVAKVVDHAIAITKGGDPFPSLSGLTSMCQACHNRKTVALDRANGCGVIAGARDDGTPADASHGFYRGYTPMKAKAWESLDRPWGFPRTKFGRK